MKIFTWSIPISLFLLGWSDDYRAPLTSYIVDNELNNRKIIIYGSAIRSYNNELNSYINYNNSRYELKKAKNEFDEKLNYDYYFQSENEIIFREEGYLLEINNQDFGSSYLIGISRGVVDTVKIFQQGKYFIPNIYVSEDDTYIKIKIDVPKKEKLFLQRDLGVDLSHITSDELTNKDEYLIFNEKKIRIDSITSITASMLYEAYSKLDFFFLKPNIEGNKNEIMNELENYKSLMHELSVSYNKKKEELKYKIERIMNLGINNNLLNRNLKLLSNEEINSIEEFFKKYKNKSQKIISSLDELVNRITIKYSNSIVKEKEKEKNEKINNFLFLLGSIGSSINLFTGSINFVYSINEIIKNMKIHSDKLKLLKNNFNSISTKELNRKLNELNELNNEIVTDSYSIVKKFSDLITYPSNIVRNFQGGEKKQISNVFQGQSLLLKKENISQVYMKNEKQYKEIFIEYKNNFDGSDYFLENYIRDIGLYSNFKTINNGFFRESLTNNGELLYAKPSSEFIEYKYELLKKANRLNENINKSSNERFIVSSNRKIQGEYIKFTASLLKIKKIPDGSYFKKNYMMRDLYDIYDTGIYTQDIKYLEFIGAFYYINEYNKEKKSYGSEKKLYLEYDFTDKKIVYPWLNNCLSIDINNIKKYKVKNTYLASEFVDILLKDSFIMKYNEIFKNKGAYVLQDGVIISFNESNKIKIDEPFLNSYGLETYKGLIFIPSSNYRNNLMILNGSFFFTINEQGVWKNIEYTSDSLIYDDEYDYLSFFNKTTSDENKCWLFNHESIDFLFENYKNKKQVNPVNNFFSGSYIQYTGRGNFITLFRNKNEVYSYLRDNYFFNEKPKSELDKLYKFSYKHPYKPTRVITYMQGNFCDTVDNCVDLYSNNINTIFLSRNGIIEKFDLFNDEFNIDESEFIDVVNPYKHFNNYKGWSFINIKDAIIKINNSYLEIWELSASGGYDFIDYVKEHESRSSFLVLLPNTYLIEGYNKSKNLLIELDNYNKYIYFPPYHPWFKKFVLKNYNNEPVYRIEMDD